MAKGIEQQIDELYARPLNEFVSARQALAKSLSGDEAKAVKALTKPTTLPWIVNQIRWHDEKAYERLLDAGKALRAAQIATLEGRAAKMQEAASAQKTALAAAVAAGVKHAKAANVGVDSDALVRMLEAVSTADTLAEQHGRFTAVVQPAGFEALLGVAVQAPGARGLIPFPVKGTKEADSPSAKQSKAELAAQREAERHAREQAEAAERREAAIAKAKAAVAEAKAEEARARDAWRKAKDALIDAEHALEDLQDR